jgi:hypothetical protein
MKKICMILLSALMLAGCAKDMSEDIRCIDDHWGEIARGDADEPILFLPETDYDNWVHMSDLDTRFLACRVPDDILKGKTTRALGLSILHYPLNYLLLYYNYYDLAVKQVYERSPLHMTLAARADAAPVLIDIFDQTSIDINISTSVGYQSITLQDEMFLEMFLGTRLVPGLDKGSNKEKIKAIVSRKMDERKADSSFSTLSLIPLAYMNERLGLGLKFDNDIVNTMHSFTMGDKLFD